MNINESMKIMDGLQWTILLELDDLGVPPF
jgi:hypothetical protein